MLTGRCHTNEYSEIFYCEIKRALRTIYTHSRLRLSEVSCFERKIFEMSCVVPTLSIAGTFSPSPKLPDVCAWLQYTL